MTAICKVKSATGVGVLFETLALILIAPSASRPLETRKTMLTAVFASVISCVGWSGREDENVHSSSPRSVLLRAEDVCGARGPGAVVDCWYWGKGEPPRGVREERAANGSLAGLL